MDREGFEWILSEINSLCDAIQEFEDVTKKELIKKIEVKKPSWGVYLLNHSFDVSDIKDGINKVLDINISIFYDAEIIAIYSLIRSFFNQCGQYTHAKNNSHNNTYDPLFTEEHYYHNFKNNIDKIIRLINNLQIKKDSNIDKIQENVKQSTSALKSIKTNEKKLQVASKKTEELLVIYGTASQAGKFVTIEKDSHEKAQKYEKAIFIFASLLMLAVVGVLAFVKIDSIFFSRLIFLVPLFTVSLIYLIILEKRYRIRAFKYKDLEVSILSLSAYLEDIDPKGSGELSAKDTFKLKMAEFYYKQVYDETKIKEKNITELVTSTIKSAKGTI
ncbi:MAG: hypothetical protein JJV96_00380 [Alphaproteobacteria bacterium]|nr:hypothetical protein [Alphaproteobacteria bacterium]